MKNLLIIQNYNANKGDSSVVHTMKKTISNMDNGVVIRLTSYDPTAARDEYGLESSEWIINFKDIKLANSKIGKIYYFFRELMWIVYSLLWLLVYKVGLKLPLPSNKKATIEMYIKSDVVVLPGGHFFTNLNGFPVNISHAYGLMFAKWLGKKTMVYSQTVGPFFGRFGTITKKIADFVIKHTNIVTLREEDSTQYCKGYKNVHVTAETVFALPTDKTVAQDLEQLVELKRQDRLIVGVTIHHIYYKHFFAKDQYVHLMAEIFDTIAKKYDCTLLIIPMEASYHKGGDRPIANEMRNLCEMKKSIVILDGDLDPLMTSSVIANTDIFIGTKTHSIVYGLKSIVPTVSISYQQKSTEFMKMFGVEENAIDLKALNLNDFMKIFDRVYSDQDKYRKIQQEYYEHVKEKSLQNNRFLLSLFGGAVNEN